MLYMRALNKSKDRDAISQPEQTGRNYAHVLCEDWKYGEPNSWVIFVLGLLRTLFSLLNNKVLVQITGSFSQFAMPQLALIDRLSTIALSRSIGTALQFLVKDRLHDSLPRKKSGDRICFLLVCGQCSYNIRTTLTWAAEMYWPNIGLMGQGVSKL